jgi:hypothetical protein
MYNSAEMISEYYFLNKENNMVTCEFCDACSFFKEEFQDIFIQKNLYVTPSAMGTSLPVHVIKLRCLRG